MLSMPRVTMNEGTPHRLDIVPLIRPQTTPTATLVRTAREIATPTDKPSILSTVPATTAQSAVNEPTERSMPPIRITKVIPTARQTLIAIWVKMLLILPGVKKSGDSTEKVITRSSNAIAIPESRTNCCSPLGKKL